MDTETVLESDREKGESFAQKKDTPKPVAKAAAPKAAPKKVAPKSAVKTAVKAKAPV